MRETIKGLKEEIKKLEYKIESMYSVSEYKEKVAEKDRMIDSYLKELTKLKDVQGRYETLTVVVNRLLPIQPDLIDLVKKDVYRQGIYEHFDFTNTR